MCALKEASWQRLLLLFRVGCHPSCVSCSVCSLFNIPVSWWLPVLRPHKGHRTQLGGKQTKTAWWRHVWNCQRSGVPYSPLEGWPNRCDGRDWKPNRGSTRVPTDVARAGGTRHSAGGWTRLAPCQSGGHQWRLPRSYVWTGEVKVNICL